MLRDVDWKQVVFSAAGGPALALFPLRRRGVETGERILYGGRFQGKTPSIMVVNIHHVCCVGPRAAGGRER
jgi:hypothetical protein